MAECILANEWWCGVTQDARRVNQLAADRKRDVWLPEEVAEAGSQTWESGLRVNVLMLRASACERVVVVVLRS